jgi:hypothetical protein
VIAQKCFCRCETIRGRRDGFCKDFYGRKHILSPTIVERLYPKKEDIKKCPEIKKFEEKPKVKQTDVKPHLESFMRRFMKCPEETKIVTISRHKNEFIALSSTSYCETINGNHNDQHMSYVIKNKQITQKCPVCKNQTSRTHKLSSSVISILYPDQKK